MRNIDASTCGQDSQPKVTEQETLQHVQRVLQFDLAGTPATTPMKPTIIAATAAPAKHALQDKQLCMTCASKISCKL